MKTIETQRLTGMALRYAMAMAVSGQTPKHDGVATYWVTIKGKERALNPSWAQSFCPESNWNHGGPLIEEYGIEVLCNLSEREAANFKEAVPSWFACQVRRKHQHWHGRTPLIAAMRCIVGCMLGDSVEVPESLIQDIDHD